MLSYDLYWFAFAEDPAEHDFTQLLTDFYGKLSLNVSVQKITEVSWHFESSAIRVLDLLASSVYTVVKGLHFELAWNSDFQLK